MEDHVSLPVFLLGLLGLAVAVFGVRYLYKKYGPKGSVNGSPGGGGNANKPK